MLLDNPQLIDKSAIGRTASANGSSFPVGPNDLDVFEIIGGVGITDGVYIYSAGLADWVIVENTNSDIYDIGLSIFDRPRSLDIVCKHIAARTFSINPDFEGSIAKATVAATDATVFQVQRVVGATVTYIGLLTFPSGSDTGTFSSVNGNAVVISRGHVLRILSPELRDATLSSIDVTISGQLFVPR